MCGFSSLDDGWCFLSERIVNKDFRFEKKIKHATLLLIWTSNLRFTSYSGTPTHRLVEQNHHPKSHFHNAVDDVTCLSGRTGNAPYLVIHTTRPSPLIAASMVHWMSPMIIEVWKKEGPWFRVSCWLAPWKGLEIRKRSFLVLGWKKNHGIYHFQKWKVRTVKVA